MDLCPSNIPRTNDLEVYNGQCYLFVGDRLDWPAAQSRCGQEGGYLVTVSSNQVQSYVDSGLSSRYGSIKYTWLGLNDRDNNGVWTWADGKSRDIQYQIYFNKARNILCIPLEINSGWILILRVILFVDRIRTLMIK